MYKDFYMYNLTNPAEFRDGAKPRFDELGPYRYRYRVLYVYVFLSVASSLKGVIVSRGLTPCTTLC